MTSAAMGWQDGKSAPAGEAGAGDDSRQERQESSGGAVGGFSCEWGLLADAYARHGAAVYALARQVAGMAAAAGVVVDAFVALWRAPRSLRPAMSAQSVQAWLLAVAHRQAVHVLRSDPERRCQSARMAAADLEQGAWDRAGPAARDLLSKLAPEERRAVVLAYFGGHSWREISVILGRPENGVKADLRAGLSRLREEAQRTGDR